LQFDNRCGKIIEISKKEDKTMDENKEFLNGENEEQTPDVSANDEEGLAEEVLESVAEDTDEVSSQTDSEAFDPFAPQTDSETYFNSEEFSAAPKKKAPVVPIVIIAAVIVLAAAVFVGYKYLMPKGNPYNNMGYINTSGRTIADVAQDMNMTLEEFLAEYSLPEDMPEDTEESAAYHMMPLSKLAEMYGMEYEDFVSEYNFGMEVTEDTPWGEAFDTLSLNDYVGEDYLSEFKEYYGFGDDITGDTKWGDVRRIVEQKNYEIQQQQEAAALDEATENVTE
jgi:hypothetical protein